MANQKLLRAQHGETRTAFHKRLQGKGWQPVDVLPKAIKAKDAANRMVLDGKAGKGRAASQRGRALLTSEVIELMLADGACEIREDPDGPKIRLVQEAIAVPVVPAVAVIAVDATEEVKTQPSASTAAPVEAVNAATLGGAIDAEKEASMLVAEVAPMMPADVDTDDLAIHEVANLFPPIEGAAFDELKADIAKNEMLVPLLLYQGKILDGRSRFKACKELGVKPTTVVWDGDCSALECVVSLNMHRRHLSDNQRTVIAARFVPLYEKEAKARMRAGKASDPRGNSPEGKGRARDKTAAIFKVEPRGVADAAKVLQKGCPQLIKALEADEISMAAAVKLADLPRKQQERVLKRGDMGVKQKVKELRKKASQARPRRDPEGGLKDRKVEMGDVQVDQPAVSTITVTLASPLTAQGLVEALRPHLPKGGEGVLLLREAAALLTAVEGGAAATTEGDEAA
jgi:ParB-like chromosome segregation protein Spo0J